ncbi:HAD superfamily hydrolase (TIGR01509 family) [Phycicoccus badiiscoriae]|uniref:HAD superfamily hydrolase (TIGR01509 family) n=1 Tax=Pedococcus badiiscoriae TaxID=642776 RepID=A0A852WPQ7_9MICO|nr:HAD superfamily hydrolase (TIGR01509 family) [Pedococcus badiiscoriae]
MPVDLVIFDCDGVLVDSELMGARIGATVLTSLGWELSADQVMERFLGRSEEYFQAEVERALGRPLPSGWDDEFEHLYDAAYATELEVVEGIIPLLDELTEQGIATCVASNGSHDKMRRTLGVTGLYERFQGRIFSARDVHRGKPAPDLYLHAARTMGVEPSRCVVVEDSPPGVASARAAGMRCIGYAASTPAERLAGPGVTVCPTMAQVRDELLAQPSQ